MKTPSMKQAVITLTALLAMVSIAGAEVKLPAIFADHMVLQRDAEVRVWGSAAGKSVVASKVESKP